MKDERKMAASVLVVDDDDELRGGVVRLLRLHQFDTIEACDGAEGLAMIESQDPDLVITDLHMPEKTGIELLEALRSKGDDRPVLVMSGAGTIELAIKATRLGALDFIEKPVRGERLVVSVENALRFRRLRDEHELLKAESGASSELLGASVAMQHVRELIGKVAASEGRVLILGENGTGKELAAAAIHAGSARRAGPLVKVNCGAVPAELIESELFGHEKGAFTGAHQTRRGKFELAQGGTLFLDEVGDMPAAMQVKLLRVLQEGTFERVGGSRTISADVRVVTATNRDLAAMVEKKEFREDLFYRLNVVAVRMPSLRERRGDIPLLAQHLLTRALARNGRRGLVLGDDALAELAQLDFPGNVRELGNLVERLMILAEGPVIQRGDVARVLPDRSSVPGSGVHRPIALGSAAGPAGSPPQRFVPGMTYRELIARAEREVLVEAIQAFKGNKSAAARALGLERAHFAKKCRALGLRELGLSEPDNDQAPPSASRRS
jgi:two-component system nitrogen regulation response regulator NtrX